MASLEHLALAPLAAGEVAGLAALWPKPSATMAVQVVEPMHVLSLRHLAGGGDTVLAAALATHALPRLPQPGSYGGREPRLIWCSPNETLLLMQDAARAAALLAALRPAAGALACALDRSAGSLVVTLQGHEVEALMARLVDAQALPRRAGQATRLRLADIAAVVWRDAPDQAGLLVDRAHAHYLAGWIRYAAEAI